MENMHTDVRVWRAKSVDGKCAGKPPSTECQLFVSTGFSCAYLIFISDTLNNMLPVLSK